MFLNLETPGEESNFHLFRQRNKYIDFILFKSESINFAAHGGIRTRVPAKRTEYEAAALPLCYPATIELPFIAKQILRDHT